MTIFVSGSRQFDVYSMKSLGTDEPVEDYQGWQSTPCHHE